MKKYCIAVMLVLVLLFVGSDKTFADTQTPFTQTQAERDKSLDNWEKSLIGEPIDTSDIDLSGVLNAQDAELQKMLINFVNPSADIDDPINMEQQLFTDINPITENSPVSATDWAVIATRIEKMATLYRTPHSTYENSPSLEKQIIHALRWYSTNVFTIQNGSALGNAWYERQISAPLSILNTLTLMRQDKNLTNELVQNYLTTIDGLEPYQVYNYGPDPDGTTDWRAPGTGANRVNKGFVLLLRGILDRDPNPTSPDILGNKQADLGIRILQPAYKTTTTGDGFYKDGTFIQHSYSPYTTGYGSDILARSADIFQLLNGTTGLTAYTGYSTIFNLLDTTYQPVLYKNETLDMTRGRAIAYSTFTSEDKANDMLYDMFIISQKKSDTTYRAKYATLLKSSIIESSLKPNFYKDLTIPQAQKFKEILNNSKISSVYPESPKNVMMSRASQMIDQKPGYVAGLSMFSKDVSAFESINGINKLGMYTGTGALSLYNGDDSFKNDYYPTVGMTSLPGTTTDLGIRKTLKTDPTPLYANTESWTGGVSDGTYGSATMDYSMQDVTESNLAAKKSWFFLDGKIVAMGNGIVNDNNLNTQTIVENRQLRDSSADFSVNGQSIALNNPTTQTQDARWAYLDNATPSQRIGYIFPYATAVNAYKTEQSGHWSDLSTKDSESPEVKSTYAGLTIPHGANPTNASYTYVILPGSSREDTEKQANLIGMGMNNGIHTSNDAYAQGIVDTNTTLLMYNYRHTGSLTTTDFNKNYSHTAYTTGSIMIRFSTESVSGETVNTKTVTLADPSKELNTIKFAIPKESFTPPSTPANATIESTGDDWTITVDTSAKTGESFSYTFENFSNMVTPAKTNLKPRITFIPFK